MENKPLILLVDDNEEILSFIADDLEDKYKVITARDGQAAMLLLQEQPVQLVISDVMMPVMDGFELCRIIKSDFVSSHIPVILLTARNTMQSKIEGLELGADAYIEKPFSPEFLQAQIASLLSNRHKIKSYYASTPLVHLRSMAYTSADEQFLEKLNDLINQHLNNIDLDVEQLADFMNMSRPTFYRKIKAISDLTPHELINIARLKKAASLLSTGSYKVNEVAELCGFASLTNFGKNFQKQFGILPSRYVAQIQAEKER
ncbi:Helix-turn-helix domain-containing protein [Chitinophaga ginsengisegetis]|uniref:Helix-turn-helix domain-containing protein n=1 Tax=Chitinophaga ginsengisegetis TaxID=393003 RepID=A0A1T5NW88_9BACT|nr:response regulator [Chitinophaga ginsengisegetis]MDR6567336.1 DNA-binding response OmpR family regulator [Chitinophaga ginsengisegetis]MDR6647067.1 DNA-binding response OmpR family regulator [Chitinophaga ginsengisegetis]MDR6653416.1 DNA-binding response OmpR family regulator [Chitinophaga ginsengisegetis]SKD04740.1 Helix-turn-helix domain-containing protein [Chitinophaga ginsengisegetis]